MIFTPRRRPNAALEALTGAVGVALVGGIFVSAQIAGSPAHPAFHTDYRPLLWLSAVVTAFAFGVQLGRARAGLIAAVPAAIAIAVELADLDEPHRPSSLLVSGMIVAVALAATFGAAARFILRPR